MAIEFRCTGCNKLLRVANDSAGRRTRCPDCEAVMGVPEKESPNIFLESLSETYPEDPPFDFPDVASATRGGSSNFSSSDFSETENPFQSPLTEGVRNVRTRKRYSDQHLASRLTRLGAVILDSLLYAVAMIPMFIVMILSSDANAGWDMVESGEIGATVALAFCGLALLGLSIYQWVLISSRGQSLGKMWLGIKILLDDNGKPPGFMRGVILRMWVPQVIGAIPILGPMFGLTDVLTIFTESRRTLHDRIAGTSVVNA